MSNKAVRTIARSSSKHVMYLVTGYVFVLGLMLTMGSAYKYNKALQEIRSASTENSGSVSPGNGEMSSNTGSSKPPASVK